MRQHKSAAKKPRASKPSVTKMSEVPHSIAQAVIIKDEDLFFVTDPDGVLPLDNRDGFGLYYHDCRFLDGYQLRVGGQKLNTLVASAELGYMAKFELTNPDITLKNAILPKQSLDVAWERIIDAQTLSLRDVFCFINYSPESIDVPLEFAFSAQFDDVFEVRGMKTKRVGKALTPKWHGSVLTFSYNGSDGIRRMVQLGFSERPRHVEGSGAMLGLKLKPGERHEFSVAISVAEFDGPQSSRRPGANKHSHTLASALQRSADEWLGQHAEVESDSDLLNEVMNRSIRDLRVLCSNLHKQEFFSAGLPWYGTLFGRDSITAALQMLAYRPEIAMQTLRLLARYQGQHEDAWRDEQPGKIMHELRRGELAHLNEIPQTPYYGAVDSTPLFLILISKSAKWTGSLELFHELRPNIERALKWMDTYADIAGNGYLAYQSKSKQGLGNQGWKDSGVSIMNADGSLAKPPISLVEVQGYAFLAKLGIASLCRRVGDDDTANRLEAEAEDLRKRFNRDFWVKDMQYLALALQKDGHPAAVISSNAGQALWSGIVDDTKAQKIAARLMKPDMFSAWGVRTLSTQEKRYNPIGYHLGTVWPHDNSIIVAGLRRYRQDEAACQIFAGILEAARNFAHSRLPEVFCGFTREQYERPVSYPVACHPQAWASGSVPFMLTKLLGIEVCAFDRHLTIKNPVLPGFINRIELRKLYVGKDSIDLRFERTRANGLKAHVLKAPRRVQIEIHGKD